ncbi:MAG: FHA domain-containing protein [Chitinivibrionales bacterium]
MPDFFIVQYPEPPILVPDRGKVTIGRADNNTIVITDPRVSRLHAQIEWREFRKEFVLSDLGSSNGTYLNGNKIPSLDERALHDWDKIRVTSAVLTMRFVENQDTIKDEFKELRQRIHSNVTEILEVKDILGAQQQTGISGDLEHLCTIELYQMLESGGKTGELTLKTPIGVGVFKVLKGKIITGQFKNFQGEKAIFETLKCSKGAFAFLPLPEIKEKPQISMATTALLMEGCRLLDESHAFAAK